jgi:hypothetical protein
MSVGLYVILRDTDRQEEVLSSSDRPFESFTVFAGLV